MLLLHQPACIIAYNTLLFVHFFLPCYHALQEVWASASKIKQLYSPDGSRTRVIMVKALRLDRWTTGPKIWAVRYLTFFSDLFIFFIFFSCLRCVFFLFLHEEKEKKWHQHRMLRKWFSSFSFLRWSLKWRKRHGMQVIFF